MNLSVQPSCKTLFVVVKNAVQLAQNPQTSHRSRRLPFESFINYHVASDNV